MDLRVPALCGHCGGVFIGAEWIDVGETLTVEGKVPFECPYCTETAYLMEGVFAEVEGVVSLIAVPADGIDRLGRMLAILEDAQSGRVPLMDAVQRILAEAPELGPQVACALDAGTVMAFLALLLAVVTLMLQVAHPPATLPEIHALFEQSINHAVHVFEAQHPGPGGR